MTAPVEVSVDYSAKGVAPVIANVFQFQFAGNEFELTLGYVAPREGVAAVERARVAKPGQGMVVPELVHRFILSPQAFERLKAQVDDIAAKYAKDLQEKQRG